MKFATFRHEGRSVVGQVGSDGETVNIVDDIKSMLDLIARFDDLRARIESRAALQIPFANLALQAPIPRPLRNIFCVGKNYRAHAKEFSQSGFDNSGATSAESIPEAPIVFTKAPESVIGTGAAVRYPLGVSDSVDYEAELAVVIGKGGRGIAKADAFDHVWGYTIVNDVTARDWQERHKQWFLGKSFDTFCPMGPWIVTRDEVDVGNLEIRCWINGDLRQSANTRELIFDIPTLIETISSGITLFPGDIIATGTPAGVGIGFRPPKFLAPGDEMRIEIAGIGRLTNRVV